MKIVIAGASGGVGWHLSNAFDRKYHHLILTYNTNKGGVLKPEKATHEIIQCNFTVPDQVAAAFDGITGIDVLINTMGTTANSLVKDMVEDEWNRVIESNLKTVFISCATLLKKMTPNGHIINMSSVLAATGMIGASNYAAAKGGVESFTRSFAKEGLRVNVNVNAIALGYFDTGMGKDLPDAIKDFAMKRIPKRSFGDPSEIIKLVKYIISTNYLVGQVIHLDGGLT